MATQQPTPELLLIVKERLRPGSEEAYGRIESEIAEMCARLQCPNPYLALESVGGPKEVWWLNTFLTDADKARVERAYADNEPLMTELLRLSRPKESLTFEATTVLGRHRRDLSGEAWRVAGARFFVVTVANELQKWNGAVFEAPNGDLYTFAPAATRAEADRMVSRGAGASVVFAVQPRWSFPADAWIAADPEFWKASHERSGAPTGSSFA